MRRIISEESGLGVIHAQIAAVWRGLIDALDDIVEEISETLFAMPEFFLHDLAVCEIFVKQNDFLGRKFVDIVLAPGDDDPSFAHGNRVGLRNAGIINPLDDFQNAGRINGREEGKQRSFHRLITPDPFRFTGGHINIDDDEILLFRRAAHNDDAFGCAVEQFPVAQLTGLERLFRENSACHVVRRPENQTVFDQRIGIPQNPFVRFVLAAVTVFKIQNNFTADHLFSHVNRGRMIIWMDKVKPGAILHFGGRPAQCFFPGRIDLPEGSVKTRDAQHIG